MVPSIWYRLFFTRDDDLDLLQVMFLLCIVFFAVAFGLEGVGVWKPSDQAWATFRVVFAILAISGTPVWVAHLLAKSKVPGEVAQAPNRNDFGWLDDGIRPPGLHDDRE